MFTFLLANLSLGSILAGMFSVGISMTAGQVTLLFIVTFFLGFFLGMLFEQFKKR